MLESSQIVGQCRMTRKRGNEKLVCQPAGTVNERNWVPTELAYLTYLLVADPALGFGGTFTTIRFKHLRRVGCRKYDCVHCPRSHAQVNQIHVVKMLAYKRQDIEAQKICETDESSIDLYVWTQSLQSNCGRMMCLLAVEHARKDGVLGGFGKITGAIP